MLVLEVSVRFVGEFSSKLHCLADALIGLPRPRALYNQRNHIERKFGHLKINRAIDTENHNIRCW